MKAEKTKKYLAIDSHAHIQVSHGSEQNWEFPSIEAHRAYCQRSVYARRKRVYRLVDDVPVKDGWKMLWDEHLNGSWEGRRDVDFSIEGDYLIWNVDGTYYYHLGVPASPPQKLIAVMDAVGIDMAVVQMSERYHKYTMQAAQKYPGRLILFAMVEESEAYTDKELAGLYTKVKEWGFKGYYYAPSPGWDGYDNFHTEKFDPFWKQIEALDIPVWFQEGFGSRADYLSKHAKILKWMERFPNITRVIVHGLPTDLVLDEDNIRIPDIVTEVVGHPNVYLELLPLATNEYFHPRIDDIIRAEYDAFGPRKFVWGSEFIKHLPGGAPAEPFTAAHYAELYHYLEEKHPYLSEDDLGLIRGGNLQRIFRISKTLY